MYPMGKTQLTTRILKGLYSLIELHFHNKEYLHTAASTYDNTLLHPYRHKRVFCHVRHLAYNQKEARFLLNLTSSVLHAYRLR